ncbi:uncharacterized protein LOC101207691 [Cucumis sativus]|uniref:DUF952 domain-containing protein n=1 Tax=Cucumis sativus TaxID=3659 RepID=A0A0A0LER0_CUCSA|nr:uncharacterized protein LOC101207691 [Cucumis sativus]KGN58541.1 hypothetical protein Csa_000840 [Cucumis sativus]
MADQNEEQNSAPTEEFVYRISTSKEWDESHRLGHICGGHLDKSSGFIHLSNLDQVQSTLQNFFLNIKDELYLLQIEAKKLGDGLIYELVDGCNSFPHFYGPSRSFSPIPMDAVTNSDKITFSDGRFACSLLE